MKRAARVASLALLAACGHSKDIPGSVGVAALAPPRRLPSTVVAPVVDRTPPGLEAHLVVNVPDQGIGPFLARRGDVVLAAYVGTSAEGERRVVSVPLAPGGEVRGDPKVVAPVASNATSLVVRPTGGSRPGFLAAWTSLTDRGEALSVVAMHDDGRSRGEAIELARTDADIVWAGAAPTRAGAVVVWAEQPKGADANVLAAAIGPDGALRGVPARVAHGVTGWQLVPTRDGVGLALVATVPGHAKDARPSAVTWLRLDADARPLGAPVTIAASARVAGAVEAAASQGGALVAWTDVSQADPQPVIARVDDAGKVTGPRRTSERGAGGTLVAVAPGAVAWEEPFLRGSTGRRVYLARVAAGEGALDVKAPVALALEGRGAPEVAAVGDGLALLAPASACPKDAEACDGAPVLPTFVRFDAEMGVTQVEPLRMNILRERAAVGWSLACADQECLALAVGDEASRVMAVRLAKRTSGFRPPLVPPPPPGAPRVESLDTVAAGVALADLDAARLGSGSILATLTAGSEQARRDDASSLIAVRVFPAPGAPGAPPATVTTRARPVGGVAVATTGRLEDGAAVAWVGRDAGDPQVHVTRVDERGRLKRDVKLTSVKGDATDVSIAWTGERWLVAWVDGRDGNGEVYAATLDREARDIGKGQRITNAPGDASDVALLATPDAAWVAWADPRESPQEGFADVYVAPLNGLTGARASEEVRVLATAAHSRSPVLAARGKDVALAWIEEAPMGAEASRARSYGAMFAWLGPSGRPAREPTRLPVAGDGFPTALALDDAEGALRAVLARATGEGIVLDAVAMDREPRTAFPLLTLDGPPSLDVALSVAGPEVFWNDEGTDREAKRARRAMVRWPR